MTKNEYVAALRELADFVESRDFPDTWKGIYVDYTFNAPKLYVSVAAKEDFGRFAAALGSFEKIRTEYSTGMSRTLPLQANITITADREVVCTKIITGIRVLPAEPERIVEALPERTEDIVKWVCPESFVSLKGGNDAEQRPE